MPNEPSPPAKRRLVRYVPAIGPRMRPLLWIVLGLFALLCVNGLYLSTITFVEWRSGETYQNYFYQWMFLLHLVLGVLLVAPLLVFGVLHIRNTWNRPNRRVVRVGLALFAASLVLVISGFALARLDIGERTFGILDPRLRGAAYWTHVLAPFFVAWLFVLHRLVGPRIRWRVGAGWAAVAAVFSLAMAGLHSQDPRQWNIAGPESGEQYFFPSLARTSTGDFIPADTLMMDGYCERCHADVHEDWENSAHRFASFNNPAYLFAVRETRQVAFERDGDVQASRFCAGCHDLVPFFSGAFDDPDFDDVDHPTSQAGITCTGCHAITHVNSPRGNADFTIEEPIHYPFAKSENTLLAWTGRQLVKAKPGFHKKTFLKPLHKTAEFCGSCHKVHLPEELNDYKWLRGQNHYDSYLQSGVSGHGVTSFYYPDKATHDCQTCHMPLQASEEFGAQDFAGDGTLQTHDHQFPSANTALAKLLDLPDWVNEAHREFNDGVMRVDLFALRDAADIAGELHAPLRTEVPALEPGREYLLDCVIRTVKMGHLFTEGTADSNEVWLDVTASTGDRVVGRSGAQDAGGEVDPWSHFVNAYVLDREGNRINRRNAHDIFRPLYSHQIPPGAADVVHYRLQVPEDARGTLVVEVALQYRKFDAEYTRLFLDDPEYVNDLPVMTLATDRLVFPIQASQESPLPVSNAPSPIVPWQRWNDYGIGLLRKGSGGANKGELRQAEEAFREVERLGRPDGPLNLARVYIKEGRLDDAVAALGRAAAFDPPAPPWSVAWFTGVVNKQNGLLDEALESFRAVHEMWRTAEAQEREFDFRQDTRLLNELGQTTFELSRRERGEARRPQREALLNEAVAWFEATLVIDPEDLAAHYNLALLLEELGDEEGSARHRAEHARYKPDDNATDLAVARARMMDPAANHAAESVVIYDLHRLAETDGSPGSAASQGSEDSR